MTQTAPESLGSRILVLAVLVSMLLVIIACVWLMGETQPPLRWLEGWPGLSVERGVRYALPVGAIVHVRDWHTDPTRAGDDDHLADVEEVQAEQVELLRELLKKGYRTVGVEGLTAAGLAAWNAKVEVLREQEADQAKLQKMATVRGDVGREAGKLLRMHRWEIAELGAAARVLIEGEAPTVFPLDDAAALDRATPRKVADGRWEFDAVKVKERRRAIVRNCVATGANVVVVFLGADHDLTEQVREAEGWTYIRVTTEAVARRIESPAGRGGGGRR